MDHKKLPKQEDVTETALGKLVKVTDENRQGLYEHALSKYIGEKCKFCGHVYQSVKEIIDRDLVRAGEREYACHTCWDKANESLNHK
jgi:hypothetical protein